MQLQLRRKFDADEKAQHFPSRSLRAERAISSPVETPPEGDCFVASLLAMTASCSSREQGQHAGVAVEPVARDLAIGEKPDQRNIAELLADQPGLDPRLAEQRGAARDAADVDAGLGWALQAAGQLAQHAVEIGARAVRVAAAEQDRVA